ncbi:NAD(P)-dependent oxidoreductase [Parerythrobacter aurantius]|uniref:NAD-dependent epimerase/dehydratase family protein n=1 Tax=Parerythrobacter aurantius TaxID=3127706 RepID=UPI0032512E8A
MRIALTGASGNVGTAFADEALRAGHSLVCLGRQLPSWLEGKVEFEWFDLAAPSVNSAIPDALRGVDTAVHLAAKVDTSPADDAAALAMFQTNVLGTKHLIESLAQARVGHMVLASTANFYDPRLQSADEGSLVQPMSRTIYLSSKAAQEWIAREACSKAGLGLGVMRISSVVGITGEDLIGRMAGKVIRGQAVTLTDPEFGADFVSLDSVVQGLLIAVTRRLQGDFNLSSGIRHTLQEVLALVAAEVGYEPKVEYRDLPCPRDRGFPAIECDLLRSEGYLPEPLELLISRMVGNVAGELSSDCPGPL